ncbi:MAG: dTDP-4-dehydrorhamnose reductase [Desulfuromonadales bacterium]|nr:dTDP-4-dehydrorhamnose reductase [Desulfuromonadales bacterium]
MSLSTSVTDSLSPVTSKMSRVLLIGGNGMLAQKISAVAPSCYDITAVDLPVFDMTDKIKVLAYVENLNPEIIINCAAYTNVDGCEIEQALADQVNGAAVGFLAEAAKKVDAVLAHISTDYVFDGEKKAPYEEEDTVNPQSAYGRSKLLGERELLSSGLEKFFIVRTSWLYGPGGNNFVETIIRLSKERSELGIVSDQIGSPTYTGDLAAAVFNLLMGNSDEGDVAKGPLRRSRYEGAVTEFSSPVKDSSLRIHPPYGLYHFSNQGQCSWYEFSKKIVALARANGESLQVETINPIKTEDYPLPAERPKNSVFSKEKYLKTTGQQVPGWEESLAKYMMERRG